MKGLFNNSLVFFSFIHKTCPLCVISHRYPRSRFAK